MGRIVRGGTGRTVFSTMPGMQLDGTLMLADAQAGVRLAAGSVRIEGGRVVGVDLHRQQTLRSPLIAPGFVDAHLHLPQLGIVGAHGRPLLDWLAQVTFPAEARWADAGFAEAASHRAIDQLLAHGTTSFAGYATSHHAGARAALRVCADRDLRAVVGQVLMDRGAPADLCVPAERALDECEALLSAFADLASVTPRFALGCSAALLRGAGALAQRCGARVQTHISENRAECEQVRRLHGADYVTVYDRAGLLGPRSILAHGVHLSDAERARLIETQTVVAHCPTANVFLHSGIMRHFGGRLALGSDLGAGYERAMPRVARAMIETATHAGSPVPPAAQAWAQITHVNADTLGMRDVGRIARGCRADLLRIEPDMDWPAAPDPLGMLLFGWDDRWITQVLVAGVRQV